jgi:hypothetical protein
MIEPTLYDTPSVWKVSRKANAQQSRCSASEMIGSGDHGLTSTIRQRTGLGLALAACLASDTLVRDQAGSRALPTEGLTRCCRVRRWWLSLGLRARPRLCSLR